MPTSRDTEDRSQTMVFESGISEYQQFYAPNLPESLTSDFFTLDTTVGYFPTLRLNDMYVPAGNAKPYCLHFDWNWKDQRNQIGRYKAVEGLPTCSGAADSKRRWDPDYPKDGADFKLWKQHMTKAPTEDECKPNSVFVPHRIEGKLGTCWRYDVLESVCLLA